MGGKMKRKVGWWWSVAGQTGSWRQGANLATIHLAIHGASHSFPSQLLHHEAPPPGSKALTECILAAWCRAVLETVPPPPHHGASLETRPATFV